MTERVSTLPKGALAAGVGSLTAQVQEVVVLQAVDGLQLAANVKVLGDAEEVLDARVGVVIAAKDQLGLLDPKCAVSSLHPWTGN